MSAATPQPDYPARLSVDYPAKLDRLTTALRLIWVIPIAIILTLVSGGGGGTTYNDAGERVRETGTSIGTSIAIATAFMIVFRQRYPRWWFDFQLALVRFGTRVASYVFLLRDEYPSTEDEQAVHLEVDYPDVRALNSWMPLVKWFLAIPHFIVLVFLGIGLFFVVIIAWFAILIGGTYPRALFDYAVGFQRWALRVWAYAGLLVTDRYPPFTMS